MLMVAPSPPGLFKVATGEDITKAEQPGTFDLKVRLFISRRKRTPKKISILDALSGEKGEGNSWDVGHCQLLMYFWQ